MIIENRPIYNSKPRRGDMINITLNLMTLSGGTEFGNNKHLLKYMNENWYNI